MFTTRDLRGIQPRQRRLVRVAAMCIMSCALALSTACSGNTTPGEEAVPVEPTYVKVQNRAYLDMNIYVFRSSQRIRLGTVNGNNTSRLLIPASLLFGTTPLRFMADPIGGRRQPTSEEINVSPGDEVVLTIPPS